MSVSQARVENSDQVRIRLAAPADCDAILALYCEVHDAHVDGQPGVFRLLTAVEEASLYRDFAAASGQGEGHGLLVAECSKGLVGCVRFEWRHTGACSGQYPRSYVYVSLLVVAPKWQNRGVGRSLLEQVHQSARRRGVSEVELHVYEFNQPGTKLYERMGYRNVARRMRLKID